MGEHTGRFARTSLVLVLLAIGSAPAAVAQSIVTNPTTLVFTASADHDGVLSNGLPAVSHYSFDVYLVGAAQPFQQTDIGKPVPASDGTITYDFRDSVASWPLPGGSYEARVSAMGPAGSGTSERSNPFTFSSCGYALSGTSASLPAAGGGTQVSVSTEPGCSWSATSGVSWVTLSAAGGTGGGTIVATVAANGSTTARSAVLNVAGRAFTINQAAASASTPSTVPGAPSSPAPASGATGIGATPTLTWTASGATSYTVRFGTVSPPPQVASGRTSASYAPGTLAAETRYYWQVVAANAAGSTAGTVWSFATAATPPPAGATPLPAPWTGRDIGSVTLAGSASYASTSGTFTVAASGADIWGTADGLHYVYQPLSGNGEIVARVTKLANTNTYAKAGVMLRETLSAGSRHVMLDWRPNGEVELMTRSSTSGTTTYLKGATQTGAAWLKLTRSGTTVTASVSADGATWRTVGSTSVSIGTAAYVGLCVTSHNTATRTTATFDNVRVSVPTSSALPSPWQTQDVGSVGLSGSALYAAGQFAVTGAGADIWGAADAFRFVRQPLGDGEIVARLTGQQNTNAYAKAGIMLRASTSAGAAHVLLSVTPGGHVEFMKRSSTGGSTTYVAGATQGMPAWLRLVRTGTSISAAVSSDGLTWRNVGGASVSLGTGASVGLAVTSHDTTKRNTATFDGVKVTKR